MNRRPPRARILALLSAALVSLTAIAEAGVLVTEDISVSTRFRFPGTSAVVDTAQREIRLPRGALTQGLIDSRPDGLGLVTLNGGSVESYAFDGTRLSRVPLLQVTPLDSPLAAAGRLHATDMVTLSPAGATRYNFSGAGMVENPLLAVTGLVAPLQVVSRPLDQGLTVLDAGAVRSYAFTGQELRPQPSLSITSGLSNPLGLALHPANYDLAVVDSSEVRYFSFNGTSLVQNPLLSVTGLTNPVGVQIARTGLVYVMDAAGVVAFGFDGTQMRSAAALAVPEAAGALAFAVLGDDSTIAVRFAEEIRVFQYTGSGMRENPALRIGGLTAPANSGQYAPSGVALSALFPVTDAAEALALTAVHDTPTGTALRFEVSGDGGVTWVPARLGKGVFLPAPSTAGAAWRAILTSSDGTQTPRVLPNVVLRQVWRPDPPGDLRVHPADADGLIRSATPTLRWQFTDRDVPDGDSQQALQVQIYDADSGALVYSSGKLAVRPDADPPPDEGGSVPLTQPDFRGALSELTVPAGVLHSGTRYTWRVRVWDQWDLHSLWSATGQFEILALQNLTVESVVSPPEPLQLPTRNLPVPVKAGAQFTFSVESLGPVVEVEAVLSDGGRLWLVPDQAPGSSQNRWAGSYFTAPTLPDGTLVNVSLTGWRADGRMVGLDSPLVRVRGTIHSDYLVILKK